MSEYKTLLALDPSAQRAVSTTGWAWGTYSDTCPFELVASGVVEGGFVGFRDDSTVRRLLTDATTVVCEKFVKYQAHGDPTPMMIEGVVSLLRPDAVFQPASGKNTICPDTLLKSLGMWSTGGHHHDQREATRHALVYLIRQLHKPTLDLIRKVTFG